MAPVRPTEPIEEFRQRLEERLLDSLTRTGKGYYLLVGILLLIVAWGIYAYSRQLQQGLIVTGMRDRILWGLYITLFVFFIGISHAGALVSAILQITKAGWRTPITRMAELITVAALMMGALFPILDQGRPDRIPNLLIFGRWQSPIIWDILSITTYLTGSIIFLYLPLIPDLALCRDRLDQRVAPWKHWFYRVFSLGWQGSPMQRRYLSIAIGMMMVLIIPIAVSVHTVVSWIFVMTLREPWNNPMFGIFFVAGAIFSGIAAIIVFMAILRKTLHLEEYITPKHFINLGYMLGAFSLIMIYFNASEFIVAGYKMAGETTFHFQQLFIGPFAPLYWSYALGGLVLPGLLILLPWTRTVKGVVTASVLVLAGMWVERYVIVVGGLRVPLMPYEPAAYFPTWVEWSIMAGAMAGFILIITLTVKLFPVITIWEMAEHYEAEMVRVPRREAVAWAEAGHSHAFEPTVPNPGRGSSPNPSPATTGRKSVEGVQP
ncbi:MAG: NrfD/PsrC family molybdoenzyme membrane anchor subunit [Anaerolineae bacterium]